MSVWQGFQRDGVIEILGGIAVNGKQHFAAQIQSALPILLADEHGQGIGLIQHGLRERNGNAVLVQNGIGRGLNGQTGAENFHNRALREIFLVAAEQHLECNAVAWVGVHQMLFADDDFRQLAAVIVKYRHFAAHDNAAGNLIAGLIENAEHFALLAALCSGFCLLAASARRLLLPDAN